MHMLADLDAGSWGRHLGHYRVGRELGAEEPIFDLHFKTQSAGHALSIVERQSDHVRHGLLVAANGKPDGRDGAKHCHGSQHRT
jgi:hypothetical protein